MRDLDLRDQNFIRELVLGVTRHKLRLDRIIEKYYTGSFSSMEDLLANILRTGLYQLMFMDSVPDWAAVNESVELAVRARDRKAGGLVNAILRRYLRDGEPLPPADENERLSVVYSHPRWLVDRWLARFGPGTTESMLAAGNEKHPVFIRARRERITAEELSARLRDAGFETAPIPGAPDYLSVSEGSGLFDSIPFAEGLFTSQDPSAGMAVDFLDPQPGDSVLDLCAAPGGKSTRCAELMGDFGTVTAVDVHPGRLDLVRQSAERLGLASIKTVAGDALTFGRREGKTFDRVLLDAPCSGTGVFSKRPDMKWRLAEDDIARLSALQRKMLDNAADRVKPGGILVYSTCTLERGENEDNVAGFLESHHDFTLDRTGGHTGFVSEGGCLILPHLMHGSGAFTARIRRGENG
ncbi:MAG: 16S rRNA (cytosine(967)-C(5))-methyltransferase RsmB [Candidatus Latescibacteria bacterium]|nr:16S rRNA (cytosine(967)-C(5))-methyltransferase RsmB [Candidatus Latescibacterota bacterium]